MCFSSGAVRERAGAISERDVFEAREALILRRETHLDQLTDKLREPRVRRVIEPLLSGSEGAHSAFDAEYVRDLGLVAPKPPLRIANPIYGEVLPRVLTSVLEDEMPEQRVAWYVDAGGGLDLDKLLAAFQDFFRRNSEHWIERARYTEAGPQLVLQAFLHRVVNGRGRIEAGVRAGEPACGPAGHLARQGRRREPVRGRVQAGSRGPLPEANGREGTRADGGVHGHQPRGRRAPGRLRQCAREGAGRTGVYRERRDWKGAPITVWGA